MVPLDVGTYSRSNVGRDGKGGRRRCFPGGARRRDRAARGLRLGRGDQLPPSPANRSGRHGRGVRGHRPADQRPRRAEDRAAVRFEGPLRLQAGVSCARRRAPSKPGPSARAGRLRGDPGVLHDGAHRGERFSSLRALPRGRGRPPHTLGRRHRSARSERSGARSGSSRRRARRWLPASTTSGSGRPCASSSKDCARCTAPASCTATSSHRTSW